MGIFRDVADSRNIRVHWVLRSWTSRCSGEVIQVSCCVIGPAVGHCTWITVKIEIFVAFRFVSRVFPGIIRINQPSIELKTKENIRNIPLREF